MTEQVNNNQETKPSKKPISHKVKELVGVLLLFTPMIYLMGMYADYNYLSAYGIEEEFYPRTHEHYFVKAYEVFLSFFNKLTPILSKNIWFIFNNSFISGYIFITLLLYIVYWLYRKSKQGIDDKKVRSWISNTKIFKFLNSPNQNKTILIVIPFLSIFTVHFMMFLILFAFQAIIAISFLVFFILPFFGHTMGGVWGKEEIEQMRGQNCIKNVRINNKNCIYIYPKKGEMVKKNQILKGYLIAKSSKYIAVWTGDFIINYPLTDERLIIKTEQETIVKDSSEDNKKNKSASLKKVSEEQNNEPN